MIFKKFNLKATLLALSLLALSAKSELFAASREHCDQSYHRCHKECYDRDHKEGKEVYDRDHKEGYDRDHKEGKEVYDRDHKEGVIPAQAIYQDETAFTPVANQPISFFFKGFKTNFDVHSNRSVFEVIVPGLYSIDAFLLVNLPNTGDSVAGYITINEKRLLPFFSSETRTLCSPIVEFHFNDRLVYLEKGDKISVILSEFAPETTVLARGIVIVALNNSR